MGGNIGRGERKIKHFHFGDVVKRSSYGKEVIIVRWPIISLNEYNKWKQLYEKGKEMRKDSLFMPENEEIKPYADGGILNCCCCAVEN